MLRILDEIEQAESLLSQSRREVSGLLRVTAPGEFGRQHIVPIAADFQRQHPLLAVQLDPSDAVLNLLESGHDLAIRFGSLEDSTMIARRLAPNYRVACAAPAHLAQHGTPNHPAELVQHRCILIGDQRRAERRFHGARARLHRLSASAAAAGVALGAGVALSREARLN